VFEKYYLGELQFLRELGEEFARAHPAAAHYLAGPSKDPEVERMLEGFAFLSARVRQKLDDEFPEITHGLFRLLWPHYLRPLPSMAMLEFTPVMQALRQTQRIPRGAEVRSIEVEGTACRFRTTVDVTLHPLSLEEVAVEARPNGSSRLRLGFRLHNQARPADLGMDRLRLHLHGAPEVSRALYRHLCRDVEDVRVVSGAGPLDGPAVRAARLAIAPGGFGDDEALLPWPAASFPGHRLLQEYVVLPEKFLCVDLSGLGALAGLEAADRFTVDVRFDRALSPSLRPTRDDVKLFCTPIVNLFAHEADPLRLDGSQHEYRVRPSGTEPLHHEVFSVDRVRAYAPGTGEGTDLPDFYDFTAAPDQGSRACWFLRQRPAVVDDRLDAWIAFVDADGAAVPLEAETVGIDLTCTNRRLPEALRPGDVKVPSDSSPAFVQFRNLAVPTPSGAPSLGGDLPWRLVSHMALNYVPLASVEALRGVLELYHAHAQRDPRAARAHQRRLEGLSAVRSEPVEALVSGALLRGTAITIDVLEDHFAGDGDLYLFATVLNEFLSLHATLNAFTQLTVQGLQKGEVLAWPHRIGRELL
jgi:type VI secretion system protein ImpG